MPRPAPPIRSALAAVYLCALLALTVACSSTSESKPPTADATTTTTTDTKRRPAPTTTQPTGASDQQTVATAYVKAYQSLAAASTDPAGQPAVGLDDSFEGESLRYATDALDQLRTDQIKVVYPSGEIPTPTVESVAFVSPSEANLNACLVDTGTQIDLTTGAVVDDQIVSRATRATMRLSGNHWRLSSAESAGEWSDGTGCAR